MMATASYMKWPQRQRPFLDLKENSREEHKGIFIQGQRLLIKTTDSKPAPNRQPSIVRIFKSIKKKQEGEQEEEKQQVWSPSEPGCTFEERRAEQNSQTCSRSASACRMLRSHWPALKWLAYYTGQHVAAVLCVRPPHRLPSHTGGVNSVQPFLSSLTVKWPRVWSVPKQESTQGQTALGKGRQMTQYSAWVTS